MSSGLGGFSNFGGGPKSVASGLSSNTRDINVLMAEFQSEQPPERVNKGPFHVFAIIDGHRGEAVAKFIHEHLIDLILRNENMMVFKYF
jgi:hypothetical protein